ncbi:MAG: S-layer domain-containing protein [Parcubacteria group bacterium GW2011_GWE2_39_37]|uniref:S-layer domain-containing protein n=1 Tax=Candidatus Falkowbacteria bacterium GW2011_GWF2_39_8 TaxID=1618642 RepID=A0A0G0PSG9_9BACT|nr:MAG: S-layer domain-containing protein [Parcubacteria group bacterium GW2011_GWE2_39_37]KKR31089.1 MAG: S-layer domain-containing protein [Candidatus Falkowbacteria bacterium GW2011_GWF2_39_8]
MFDDLNNSPEVKTKTEDIFAGVEKNTIPTNPKPVPFQPVEPAASAENLESLVPGNENKKYFIIGAIVLALLVLAFGAWFLLNNFSAFFDKKKNAEAIPPAVNNIVENKVELVPSTFIPPEPATTSLEAVLQAETATSSVVATTSIPVVEVEKDTDGDGLTDTSEALLSTNPLLPDSDSDGLTDNDEVKIYKSNPLKDDTDGDSYKDGDEVKNGYNPLGAGKLIQ